MSYLTNTYICVPSFRTAAALTNVENLNTTSSCQLHPSCVATSHITIMASQGPSRLTLKDIWDGIEAFVNDAKVVYSLNFRDLGDIELRWAIVLAYCIEYGAQSAEQYGKCAEFYKVAERQVDYFSKTRGRTWDSNPFRTLSSRAAGVLSQGSQHVKDGRQEYFLKFKEEYEKLQPKPQWERVYRGITCAEGLWGQYERRVSDGLLERIEKVYEKCRTPEVLQMLLHDFRGEVEVDDDSDCASTASSGRTMTQFQSFRASASSFGIGESEASSHSALKSLWSQLSDLLGRNQG